MDGSRQRTTNAPTASQRPLCAVAQQEASTAHDEPMASTFAPPPPSALYRHPPYLGLSVWVHRGWCWDDGVRGVLCSLRDACAPSPCVAVAQATAMQMMQVTCPQGVGPGQPIMIQGPGGQSFQVRPHSVGAQHPPSGPPGVAPLSETIRAVSSGRRTARDSARHAVPRAAAGCRADRGSTSASPARLRPAASPARLCPAATVRCYAAAADDAAAVRRHGPAGWDGARPLILKY